MNIIIFHYHLNPGGVTRIIESQVQTLLEERNYNEIKVITGNCEEKSYFTNLGVDIQVFPEINYLLPEQTNYREIYHSITAILSGICNKEDILHFHNLNLGKNPLVTLAVSKLAGEGYKVVNHAHDFAEDRPANYDFLEKIIEGEFNKNISSVLYPHIDNYNFAVLNSYDLNRLSELGVSQEHSFLLPNPVVFSSRKLEGTPADWKNEITSQLAIQPDKKIITYPVRVIRRKNIGEYILLAHLFSEEASWLVTQPPKNPVEIEPYEKWKAFCEKENINVIWEAGTKCDFEKLLKATDICFTTSIQEGFGMVFMEPWLLGTAVKGRDIPMVTLDLKQSGVEFPVLYPQFLMPDNKELHEHDLEEQFEIIQSIKEEPNQKKMLFEMNTFLSELLNPVEDALIKRNNEVILSEYSLKTYGKKLNEIYRAITG